MGVDIFFVISGFLIASQLRQNLENHGSLLLLSFYERRIRRIIPPLLTVIYCCLPAAWYVLLPQPFMDFSKSILATLFFDTPNARMISFCLHIPWQISCAVNIRNDGRSSSS